MLLVGWYFSYSYSSVDRDEGLALLGVLYSGVMSEVIGMHFLLVVLEHGLLY